MPDRAEVERLIAAAYDTRNGGCIAAVLDCFHPDIAFRIAGSGALAPLTTPQRGHEAFAGLLRHLIDNWDLSGLAARIVCIDGDTAVVHRQGTIRHIPTGRSIQTDVVDLLKIAEGRIVAFDEFLDTYALARASNLI